MSLLEHMSGGEVFRKVHVSEIRPNPINFYSQINEDENILVNDMASLLLEDGQDANGIVYVDTSIDDGKKYTLIGGHRRFLAISYLAERGEIEPLINVNVVSRPQVTVEEEMLILADNHQRTKDKATKIREIKSANDYWNYLVSINQKPRLMNGQKKRDWIAKKTGYSARAIQDILSDLKNVNRQQIVTNNSTVVITEIDNKLELKKSLKRATNAINKAKKIAEEYTLLNDECITDLLSIHERIKEILTQIER